MDPARSERKHVPEWLNSSLWSSPRSSEGSSPPLSTPNWRLPSEDKHSHQQHQHQHQHQHPVVSPSGIRASPQTWTSPKHVGPDPETSSDAVASVVAAVASAASLASSSVLDPDSVKEAEIVLDSTETAKDIKLDSPATVSTADDGSRALQSNDLQQGCNAADNDKKSEKLCGKAHDIAPLLEDDESFDLFNTEGGPLPSPLSSANYQHSPISTSIVPPSVTRSSSFDSRVSKFNAELSKKVISLAELQRCASQGVPDSGSIRALTWKLLLGYLPKNRDLWSTELDKKRAEYASFKEELLVTPTEVTRGKDEDALDISCNKLQGPIPRHDITQDDHPLSLGKTSIWHQFFVDSEVWEQIDRDVKRTHPDMHFFCGDSTASLDNQEAMKRVLFIFSKLNSGIRYVQGMNEVLAPLYYVFKTDTDEHNAVYAEADSFYCFVLLLGDFRDHFVQQLDNSAVGIRSTISKLNELLRRHDEELWRHLEHSSKVNPQFYAFRWITLLLAQEFNFPDSLRLWDSLLANPEGPLEILLRVCCAMLITVRSHLLAGDFTSNLKLLQHYPSVDIHHLLRLANNLKTKTSFFE